MYLISLCLIIICVFFYLMLSLNKAETKCYKKILDDENIDKFYKIFDFIFALQKRDIIDNYEVFYNNINDFQKSIIDFYCKKYNTHYNILIKQLLIYKENKTINDYLSNIINEGNNK